jgi:hypothetical protein
MRDLISMTESVTACVDKRCWRASQDLGIGAGGMGCGDEACFCVASFSSRGFFRHTMVVFLVFPFKSGLCGVNGAQI